MAIGSAIPMMKLPWKLKSIKWANISVCCWCMSFPDSIKEKETEAQAYAAVWDIMMAIQKKLPRAFVYYGQDSVEDGGKRYDGLGVFLPIHKFADRLEKMIGIADEIVMK